MSTLNDYADGGEQSGKNLSTREQVYQAVASGLETAKEVEPEVDCSLSHTYKVLRRLHEDGELARERRGNSKVYFVPDETSDDEMADEGDEDDDVDEDEQTSADEETDGRADTADEMPVDRSYNWDDWTLDESDVPEYIEIDGELDDIRSFVDSRDETGMLPHASVSGPTGAAKTTLALNIAAERDAPLFQIQCGEGLRVADLLGSPTLVGDETRWSDGTITKALLASQEREVVVLLDEINRAPGRSKALLFEALDDRCSVTLDSRGGEKIEGDPMNLIVISTMNKGPNYMTNPIDTAEKRRLGPEWPVDHLGLADMEAEVELVTERTPVCEELATKLVDCANDIREKAQEPMSPVSFGTSTALVMDWARLASAVGHRDNPVVHAARRVLVTPYHSDNDEERDFVTELINKHLDGCPVGREDVRAFLGLDPADDAGDAEDTNLGTSGRLDCNHCGWIKDRAEADITTTVEMVCPECGGSLVIHETEEN